jgi:UDP-perosamine 4-acetyltransferase
MDGVIINTGTTIGDFSIINTNSSIDHDCKIGSFTHVAPGVTISGGVEIGDEVLIGIGSSIVQYKKIVKNTCIAAGSVVANNILEAGTYIGIPARLLQK